MNKIVLTPPEQQALQLFVSYLKNMPKTVRRVALFGSKARNDGQIDSDIDVLIILAQEDRELRRQILRQAARFSLKYDVLLSPHVIGATRWEQMRGFSLYQNIQREAAELGLSGSLLLEPA